MIVLAISDKGGTGRSVTCANLAYRLAWGYDPKTSVAGTRSAGKRRIPREVSYLDFDFGSPTSGAIFGTAAPRGVRGNGLHSYLTGSCTRSDLASIDVWAARGEAEIRPYDAADLRLFPGDEGGAEFALDASGKMLRQCLDLLDDIYSEDSAVFIDLSAGRSFAAQLALALMRERSGWAIHWLVFHRWTRQHIIAGAGLVYGERGLLTLAKDTGIDPGRMARNVGYVRTAVIDPLASGHPTDRPELLVWLAAQNRALATLAQESRLTRLLGEIPLEPLLQWREQLLTDDNVTQRICSSDSIDALEQVVSRILDEETWE